MVEFHGLEPGSLGRRGDCHVARAVAAWLARRHTEATLRELASRLGLSRADGVPNLARRLEARLRDSPALADDLRRISRLLETEPPADGLDDDRLGPPRKIRDEV